MPELPDVELYLAKLRELVVGTTLRDFKIISLFVLRSVSPTPKDLIGTRVVGVRRIGKRIVLEFENDRFVVIHLMIAGRLRWAAPEQKMPGGKIVSAVLVFDMGQLMLTEAGSKKRASITLVEGETALREIDRGGLEPLESSRQQFSAALIRTNQTVKNALTDPTLISGIGNAYSDEILFEAGVSPLKLTGKVSDEELSRLFEATQHVLTEWTKRLQEQFKNKFPGPGDVTAFRPEFAVHGKFEQPCPRCGNPVRRIRYADNECNYCAECQNGGKVLADRALSRLLK